MDYLYERCKYCRCTDYGQQAVNSGPHNLCEGVGCDEAFTSWQDADPENAEWEE